MTYRKVFALVGPQDIHVAVIWHIEYNLLHTTASYNQPWSYFLFEWHGVILINLLDYF
jgi:hypothetical protein